MGKRKEREQAQAALARRLPVKPAPRVKTPMLYKIVNVAFAVVFAAALLLAIFANPGALVQTNWYWLLLAAALGMALAFGACKLFMLFKTPGKSGEVATVAALMLVLVALQAFFGILMRVQPVEAGDFGIVYNHAANYAQTGQVPGEYFLQKPAHSGLYLLLSGYFSLLGLFGVTDFVIPALLLNMLAIDGAVLLLYFCGRRIFGVGKAIFLLVACVFTLPFYLFVPIFYTASLSMPFPVAMVLLWLHGRAAWRAGNKKKALALFCALSAVGAVGALIKTTVLIVWVAVALDFIILLAGKDRWKPLLAGLAVVAVLFGGGRFGMRYLPALPAYDANEAFPTEGWLLMGLSGDGGLDEEIYEDILAQEGAAARRSYAKYELNSRVNTLGVGGMAQQLATKVGHTFGDGTYEAPVELDRGPVQWSFFQDYVLPFGARFELFFYVAFGLAMAPLGWMTVAGLLALRRRNNALTFARLGLLGLWLFLLVWKTGPAELVNFVPLMLLCALEAAPLPKRRRRTLPPRVKKAPAKVDAPKPDDETPKIGEAAEEKPEATAEETVATEEAAVADVATDEAPETPEPAGTEKAQDDAEETLAEAADAAAKVDDEATAELMTAEEAADEAALEDIAAEPAVDAGGWTIWDDDVVEVEAAGEEASEQEATAEEAGEEVPTAEEPSDTEEEVPAEEGEPADEEVAEDELAEVEEAFVTEEVLAESEIPAEEETLAEGEAPIEEAEPAAEEAVEDASAEAEEPAGEETTGLMSDAEGVVADIDAMMPAAPAEEWTAPQPETTEEPAAEEAPEQELPAEEPEAPEEAEAPAADEEDLPPLEDAGPVDNWAQPSRIEPIAVADGPAWMMEAMAPEQPDVPAEAEPQAEEAPQEPEETAEVIAKAEAPAEAEIPDEAEPPASEPPAPEAPAASPFMEFGAWLQRLPEDDDFPEDEDDYADEWPVYNPAMENVEPQWQTIGTPPGPEPDPSPADAYVAAAQPEWAHPDELAAEWQPPEALPPEAVTDPLSQPMGGADMSQAFQWQHVPEATSEEVADTPLAPPEEEVIDLPVPPAYEAPVYAPPATEPPAYGQPTYTQPVYEQLVYGQPEAPVPEVAPVPEPEAPRKDEIQPDDSQPAEPDEFVLEVRDEYQVGDGLGGEVEVWNAATGGSWTPDDGKAVWPPIIPGLFDPSTAGDVQVTEAPASVDVWDAPPPAAPPQPEAPAAPAEEAQAPEEAPAVASEMPHEAAWPAPEFPPRPPEEKSGPPVPLEDDDDEKSLWDFI